MSANIPMSRLEVDLQLKLMLCDAIEKEARRAAGNARNRIEGKAGQAWRRASLRSPRSRGSDLVFFSEMASAPV